jgi:hypothetical protein
VSETSYTGDDLARIRAAIARGERTVQFADRSVTYASIDDLLKAERAIAAALAAESETRSKLFYVAPMLDR